MERKRSGVRNTTSASKRDASATMCSSERTTPLI
jgi:hypothetical protein